MSAETRKPTAATRRRSIREADAVPKGATPGLHNQTIASIAAISDDAQFERLATSVLRAAKPSVYENISHPGVNADGRAVKGALDNFGWVHSADGSMLVAVAHTTTAIKALEGKWLHDPSTVIPKKPGEKPTQPEGDLLKAIKTVRTLRRENPHLKATLALTCSREEPPEVRAKAQALADANDLILDVWSGSRLAQFLDTNPDGQAIRSLHFGVPPVRLSKTELLRIGHKSLAIRRRETESSAFVARDLGEMGGHVLLSGGSGMGKSTVCEAILDKALSDGLPGIMLSDQTVLSSISLVEALEAEMRRYSPALEAESGRRALELCSEVQPLIVVVEDINRSSSPERVLNTLVGWVLNASNIHWRLLCPVWPQLLAAVEKRDDITKAGIIRFIGLYSDEEARKAVKLRNKLAGKIIDDFTASAIAKSLGNDPLLIGLYEPGTDTHAGDVIAQYIQSQLERSALAGACTPTDIRDAIGRLGTRMLELRDLQPTWRKVREWLGDSFDLQAVRRLVADGRLLRTAKDGTEEVLQARHDRVLYHVLADAVAARLASDVSGNHLTDPYFAEIVGIAAAIRQIPQAQLRQLTDKSPLVAVYALKQSIATDSKYEETAGKVAEEWFQTHQTDEFIARRFWCLVALAQVESAIVLKITAPCPRVDWRQPYFEARFSNGDVVAGFNLLTEYEFGTTVAGRQALIDRASQKYGSRLVGAVAQVLQRPESVRGLLNGPLLLAGYVADPALAGPVRHAWAERADDRDLEAFLWAAAQVCGDEAATTLGPVCDAWEALPESDDPRQSSPRSSLAAHGISWGFRDQPPGSAALKYFIDRARQAGPLEWPITYMLRGVDHPDVVAYEVEYIANSRRRAKDGYFIDTFLKDEWKRRSEESGRLMSAASKQRLLEMSSDPKNDAILREEAFKLWEVSFDPGDIAVSRQIGSQDVRYDTAIWARARRQDFTVIPQLLDRIESSTNPGYWWQIGRHFWSEELTAALRSTLEKMASAPKQDREHLGMWMIPELMRRFEPPFVEALILPVWERLRHDPHIFQLALRTATPKLLELVKESAADAPDPREVLRHFRSRTGFWHAEHEGPRDLEEVENIRPYFDYLSDLDAVALWEICKKRGWVEYAKAQLEPLLRARNSDYANKFLGRDDVERAELDHELRSRRTGDHRRVPRTFRWLEQGVSNGKNRKELIEILIDWVRAQAAEDALLIAAGIISNEGTRADLTALETASTDLKISITRLLDEVRFNVHRRTLD